MTIAIKLRERVERSADGRERLFRINDKQVWRAENDRILELVFETIYGSSEHVRMDKVEKTIKLYRERRGQYEPLASLKLDADRFNRILEIASNAESFEDFEKLTKELEKILNELSDKYEKKLHAVVDEFLNSDEVRERLQKLDKKKLEELRKHLIEYLDEYYLYEEYE